MKEYDYDEQQEPQEAFSEERFPDSYYTGRDDQADLDELYRKEFEEADLNSQTSETASQTQQEQPQTQQESEAVESVNLGDMNKEKASYRRLWNIYSDIDESPINYLLSGLLPDGPSVGFLYGPPACGKTLIAINISAFFALGFNVWRGIRMHGSPERRHVFYFCSEGERYIKKRFNAILQDLNLPKEALNNNLHIFRPDEAIKAAEDLGTNSIFFSDKMIQYYKKTIEAVSDKAGLIIIDTMNGFFGEDENDNNKIAIYTGMIKSYLALPFNATVITIHHVNAESQNKRAKDLMPRGGSASYGNADFALAVAKEKDHNPTDGVEVYNRKQKDIEDHQTIYLVAKKVELRPEYWPFNEDGEAASALIIDHSVDNETAKKFVESQWCPQAIVGLDKNRKTAGENRNKLLRCIEQHLIEYEKLDTEEEAYKITHEEMAKAIEHSLMVKRENDKNFSQYMRAFDPHKDRNASYFCGSLSKHEFLEVKKIGKDGNRPIYEYVFKPKRNKLTQPIYVGD